MGRLAPGKSLSSERAREGSKGCALAFLIALSLIALSLIVVFVHSLLALPVEELQFLLRRSAGNLRDAMRTLYDRCTAIGI